MLYERESHIVINYSKLDEDLKDVTFACTLNQLMSFYETSLSSWKMTVIFVKCPRN